MTNGTTKKVLAVALIFIFAVATLWGRAEREAELTAAAVPGEPQYGGVLTYLPFYTAFPQPLLHADMCAAGSRDYTLPYSEHLVKGDIEKYGPRGTNEFAFQSYMETPYAFMSGQLAESWDVSPQKLVFHLRRGVYFNADHVDFMETREMTADDAAFSLNRWIESPVGKARAGYAKKAYAQGDYTVVIETDRYDYAWFFWLGSFWGSAIHPPEVVQAGHAADYLKQVGTGPFIVSEVVDGSYISYVRNPRYWDKTTIEDIEYEIPFVDKLTIPLFADEATLLSSLRTGRLDGAVIIPARYQDTLAQTSPKLTQVPVNSGTTLNLSFQAREGFVFHDQDMRRAVSYGTDRDAIIKGAYRGYAEIHTWGGLGSPVYTPVDEMP